MGLCQRHKVINVIQLYGKAVCRGGEGHGGRTGLNVQQLTGPTIGPRINGKVLYNWETSVTNGEGGKCPTNWINCSRTTINNNNPLNTEQWVQ